MVQTLNEIMTKNVVTISSNQSIQDTARLMNEHNIGSIPVVDNGQLQGIITDRDITLRSTAQEIDSLPRSLNV